MLIPLLFFVYFSLNYYGVVDWAPSGAYLQAISNVLTCAFMIGYYFAIFEYKKQHNTKVSIAKKELMYFLKVLYILGLLLTIVFLLERLTVIDKLTFNLRTFISLLIGGTFFILLYYYFAIRREAKLDPEVELSDKRDLVMQGYEEQVYNYLDSSKLYLDANISLEQLSEKTDIQRHELTRLFNIYMGKTFYQVLSEHRIRYAEQRLKSGCSLKIESLAHECGFNSKTTFNKYFKETTGYSPSEYRNAHINQS